MDRNRLIAEVTIAFAIIILLFYGLIQWRKGQPRAGQKSPLAEVAYCSSEDVGPCIISFSLDTDGNMLVNILTPRTSFPAFYLKIIHENGESIYECQKVEKFPKNVYCVGQAMQVGKVLQFLMISKKDETLLAEGKFAIIGLALPTPEDQLTASVSPVSLTQEEPLEIVTATPTRPKSTPSPSYPNPSPSYP